MSAATGPHPARRTGVQRLDGLDLDHSVRHVAVDLAGNTVRFTRRADGETVTVTVAGCAIRDGRLSLLIDMIVTAEGLAIPTDSELAWTDLTTSELLAYGHVTDDQRNALATAIAPAMLCSDTTVTFVDARPDLTAKLAAVTTELPHDVTLFFFLDERHGSNVAGSFAVVRWSEVVSLHGIQRPVQP